jgi:hypothetical protein
MVPGGQGPPGPGGPGVRPGTGRPTGAFAPPPPHVSYPQAGPRYGPGVVPAVIPPPHVPYGTPTPSESPVIPSPPSMGGDVFVPPEFRFRDSGAPPPRVYEPPVPIGDEGLFIPPEPSPRGSSRTPTRSDEISTTASSPRPESGIPLVVPGPEPGIFPHPQQLQPSAGPPVFVYPPSQQGSQYPRPLSRRESRSTDRSRSASPPLPIAPGGGPTIINIPGQQALAPPQVSFAPSSQRADDLPGQARQEPAPSGAQQPVVHVLPSPQRPYSEYSDRPEAQQPGQVPIIIHPPHPPPPVPMGPMGPMGPFPGGPPVVALHHSGERSRSRSRSRSTTPTRSTRSPRSPRTPIIMEGHPQMGGPQFPAAMPPGGPMFPLPHGPGFVPGPVPPAVTVLAPSHRSGYGRESPEYRDGTPESPRSGYVPSRAPSRFSDHPGAPIHPIGTIPTAVHITPSEPYARSRRGRRDDSRTPSSERDREDSRERRRRRRRDRYRTPSTDTEEERRERERRRDRRRRRRDDESRSRSPTYYSPPRVHPVPEYGLAGPSILPPQAVTHVHTYPHTGSPSISHTRTEGETEPLQHPYGPPSHYGPSEPTRSISGDPSRRRRRAPTVVEVTGPEPIHILPSGHERGETTRKYCTKIYSLQLITFYASLSPPRVWPHI